MPSQSPVLGITGDYACRFDQPNISGLGNYSVQVAPPPSGSGRTGIDFYYYGHLSASWLPPCIQPNWAYLHQGQIGAWSGDTGAPGAFHLHIALQNPGDICYCSSAAVPNPVPRPFPSLSGIEFSPFYISTQCCPVDYFISDSVMAGDDNQLPQPGHFPAIFNSWFSNSGLYGPGSTRDPGGGPGVHIWGNGLTQDFIGPGGNSAIMEQFGWSVAFWVHGGIWNAYLGQGGAPGWLGYPTSDEFQLGVWQRSNFVNGYICWSSGVTNIWSWANPPPDSGCEYPAYWQQLPGAGADIAVGASGSAWMTGTNSSINWWTGSAWSTVQGAAVRVAVHPDGQAWVVNAAGGIFRWIGSTWLQVPGGARDIGIGANGAVWVIGLDYGIYWWTGSTWVNVQGAAVRIAVAPDGNAWIVNAASNIYRWIGTTWQQLPGAGLDVGAGADASVYVVGTDWVGSGHGVHRWTGATWTTESPVPKGAWSISVAPDGKPWVIATGGAIFRKY